MKYYISVLFFSFFIQFSISQDLIWVKENGLWGAVNHQGEFVVNPNYQAWKAIFENPVKYAILKDGKWGMMNENGEIKLQTQYEDIRWYDYQKNTARIIVGGSTYNQYNNQRINFKEGIINPEGEIIVPPIYEVINYYYGFFSVGMNVPNRTDNSYSSGGRWGLLDSLGQIVIPIEYNYCHTDGKVIHAAKGKNRFAFTLDGKKNILQSEYDNFIPLSGTSYINVSLNGKYGLVRLDGSEAIPVKYDEIKHKKEEDVFLVKKHGFWGAYRIGVGEIVHPKYKLLQNCGEGIINVPNKGFWNTNTKKYFNHDWLQIFGFEGGYTVARKNYRTPFYLINTKNEKIKETLYINGYFKEGYWFLRIDDTHWEVLDISTKKFSKPFYDERNYSSNPKIFYGGLLSGKKVWIKGSNVLVSDSEIKGTPYGMIITENKKERYYSLEGEIILKESYQKIIPINSQIIAVKNELGNIELRNYNDKKIRDEIENIESLIRQEKGLCIISENYGEADVFQGQKIRYGIINAQAEIILEPIYLEVKILPKGGFVVKDEKEDISRPWKLLFPDGTVMNSERFEDVRF